MDAGVCTLNNVIWTDETRVASHPNNRRFSIWTNQAEAPIQVKMHNGGNSVMLWGCFSKHGTGHWFQFKDRWIRQNKKEEFIPEFKGLEYLAFDTR
jgi:hypothetical protein